MEDSINSSHYGIYGLSSCSDSSCISQIVEIALSAVVMVWMIVEFVMQIKVHMRLDFSWQEVMLIQIFLCLSFNICFMVWSDVILWYVIASLMDQFYFTTLVYYFSKKYFQKIIPQVERKPYIIGLLIVYAIFCLGELGTFIFMVNSGMKHCKEIAELVVSAVMITLGVLFFILAYQNEAQEKKKFIEYRVNQKVHSPLSTIWVWVLANILGQIVSEIESGLIYNQYGGQECYPIETTLQTQILAPVFMFLAYAIPFSSTLWFYRQRRIQNQEGQTALLQLQMARAQVDVDNRIQLIQDSTNRGGSSSLTEILI